DGGDAGDDLHWSTLPCIEAEPATATPRRRAPTPQGSTGRAGTILDLVRLVLDLVRRGLTFALDCLCGVLCLRLDLLGRFRGAAPQVLADLLAHGLGFVD